jgi:hypothetical protein
MQVTGLSLALGTPVLPAGARRGPPDSAGAESARGPAPADSLWHILTPEERDYFTQLAALGPLTYRPGGAPGREAPTPVGGRLDVRG